MLDAERFSFLAYGAMMIASGEDFREAMHLPQTFSAFGGKVYRDQDDKSMSLNKGVMPVSGGEEFVLHANYEKFLSSFLLRQCADHVIEFSGSVVRMHLL
jgi:hypothetical protein